MTGAAVEQQATWPPLFEEPALTYAVPEMSFENRVRSRAAQLITATLSEHAPIAEIEPVPETIQSLAEAIHLAGEGDPNALHMVKLNAKTDMVERGIKVGHVMNPVPLNVSRAGKIIQHGQTGEAIQANSLRYASDNSIMRRRIEAETRNVYRTEQLYEQGWFDNYSLVVFSLAEDIPEAGFFTETMSCAIQVTSKTDEGLAIESAFVAGIAAPGAERHDMRTVLGVGKKLNVDFSEMSRAEIIDTPVLVHNSLIPNGAIDVVKLWDEAAGGTFFGEHHKQQDYLKYRAECADHEAMWEPKAELIAKELIEKRQLIHSPLDAVKLLNKISGKHLVEQAIFDPTIDARVFVDQTAIQSVIAARQAFNNGDFERGFHYMDTAKRTEQSSSCPSGTLSSSNSSENENANSLATAKECTFSSKECPLCGKKNVLTTVTKSHIKGSCGCIKKL